VHLRTIQCEGRTLFSVGNRLKGIPVRKKYKSLMLSLK
jgi:hypothetical protein